LAWDLTFRTMAVNMANGREVSPEKDGFGLLRVHGTAAEVTRFQGT